MQVWYGILGPLEVRRGDGRAVAINGPARRLVLAALLCRAGATVPRSVLIEDLWGPVPPRTAAKTLQSHVVRLRDDLGRDESRHQLCTDATGYRLALAPEELDATAFLALVDRARSLPAGPEALATFDEALSLWRGEPYADFIEAPFAVLERLRLTEERLRAEDDRTDVALGLGQAAELVPGLEKRIAEAPYRERAWEQLVLALYRSGRQADALTTYGRAAAVFAEELGIDPGPGLTDLQARILRQDPGLLLFGRTQPRRVSSGGARCPYPGLASYNTSDADLFVGREALTARLVALLAEHAVVVVAGASGSGKSSLLRAGLVPALRSGALPGSSAWRIEVGTLAALARGSTAPDLLVLDQAEEFLTGLDEDARTRFTDVLVRFIGGGGRAVLAVRGDMYAQLADAGPMAAYAQASTLLVGSLRPDELRRVITEPAERVGLTCEVDLVDAVLDEMGSQVGALPLLSEALARTWRNREDGVLTLAGYRRAGGLRRSIERSAEETYLRLGEDARRAVRRALVRLTVPEADGWVSRPVPNADLALDDVTSIGLEAFAAARLVTVGRERVEVTHEALLSEWPRLRGWLADRRDSAAMLEQLRTAALAWSAAGRAEADLYRGPRLQACLDWLADHPDEASALEVAFLRSSAERTDHELDDARRRAEEEAQGRRRLRRLVAVLAVTALLVAVVSVAALRERSSADSAAARAQRVALVAEAGRLAALSANAPDTANASRLALVANTLVDDPTTRGALLSAVERRNGARWRVPTASVPRRMVVSADGTRVAYDDDRGQVTVLATGTGTTLGRFALDKQQLDGITADGSEVIGLGALSAGADSRRRLTVIDVASGRRIRELTSAIPADDPSPVMSSDGRWLAAVVAGPDRAQRVAVWDAHRWGASPRLFEVAPRPNALAVSDGAVAVDNADGTATVRALPGLARVGRVPAAAGSAPDRAADTFLLSPTGTDLVRTDPRDQTSLDQVALDGRTSPLVTQTGAPAVGAAFSQDGRDLAVASTAGDVNVLRTGDRTVIADLGGHRGPVTGLAWGGSGAADLFTSGVDGEVVAWDLGSASRLVRRSSSLVPTMLNGEVAGHWLLGVTGGSAPTRPTQVRLSLTDLRTGLSRSWPAGLHGAGHDEVSVSQALVSADGRTGLLAIDDDGQLDRIEVWDLVGHRLVGQLDLPSTFFFNRFYFNRGTLSSPVTAISPDGRTAYSTIDPSHIGVFALPSGRLVRLISVTLDSPTATRSYVQPLRVDPDGHLLVAGFDTGPYQQVQRGPVHPPGDPSAPSHQLLALVDPRSGRLLAQVDTGAGDGISAEAWSPDGGTLVVGTVDGTLATYDAHTLRRRATTVPIEPGAVRSVTFSSDGSTVVEAGTGLHLFDATDLAAIGKVPLEGKGQTIAGQTAPGVVSGYAPAGGSLGSGFVRWFSLRLDRPSLLRTACLLSDGGPTRQQWEHVETTMPYRSICPH